MVDLNEMAIFAKVAENLSFSAAARAFGVPPSTVSRKVTQLEERLGVPLVHRTTRRIALTAFGIEYHRRVVGMLAAAAAADASAAEYRADRPRGDLKVNAPASFGQALLAPLMGSFRERFPELRLYIGLSNRRVAVLGDDWDVVIRSGELPDSSMHARLLGRARLVIVASPACIARWGSPSTVQEVRNLPCLLYSRPGEFMPAPWSPDNAASIGGAVVADDLEFLKRLALDGQGFMMAPRFLFASEFDAGTLQEVRASPSPKPVALHAVYPGHPIALPKVRAFIDFLREALKTGPDWSGDAHGRRGGDPAATP